MGLTKKGKEFFKFNSNLTETINNMFVEDSKTWTGGTNSLANIRGVFLHFLTRCSCVLGGEYVYNLFENGRDLHFYMSHDRINALTVDYITSREEMDCILGTLPQVYLHGTYKQKHTMVTFLGNSSAYFVSL